MPAESHLEFVSELRSREFEKILSRRRSDFASKAVLELGPGQGIQLRRISRLASVCCGVRVIGDPYRTPPDLPACVYDGAHIPLRTASVDTVFSSNVLEHVGDLPALLAEVRRVTKDGGVGIHAIPTAAWKGWGTVAHYPALPKTVRRALLRRQAANLTPTEGPSAQRGLLPLVGNALFPPRHGEFGNKLTEIHHLRRSTWRRRFNDLGFEVIEDFSAGLFYTAANLLERALPISWRAVLSKFFGSGSHVFVMRQLDRDRP